MAESMQLKIYDLSLNLLGILDDSETSSLQRNYYEAGAFTFCINKNLPNSSLVAENNVVQFGDDTRAFLITTVASNIDENGKGGQKLNVSGYDLRYLFTRRIVRTFNTADAYQLTAPGETIIKTLISDQCGPTCTVAKRVFSMLQIATDQGRGGNYTISAKYTNVYEECAAAATQSLIGWRIDIDVVNKNYILDCYEGLDRSKSQTVNPYCLFSPDADSLKEASFTDTIESYRNLIYVGGNGSGADRTVYEGFDTTEPSDFDRYEMFSDSSSVPTVAGLEAVAVSALAQYKQTYTLDGQVLIKSPYVFGTNYNEGDIVTVAFNGFSKDIRILSVEEGYQFSDKSIAITWGKPAQTISGQVSSVSSSLVTSASTSETGTNTSGMKAGVKSYDLSSGDATMNANQCIYNILELTGTLTANRTLTLYLDTSTLYGKKIYHVFVAATGNFIITLTTGISGKANVSLTATGENYIENIFVDDTGNVYKCGANNQITYTDSLAHAFTIPAGLPIGTTFSFMVSVSSASAVTATASGSELIEGASSFVVHGAKVSATIDTAICRIKKVDATNLRFVEGMISGSNSNGYYKLMPDGSGRMGGNKSIAFTGSMSGYFGSTAGSIAYGNAIASLPYNPVSVKTVVSGTGSGGPTTSRASYDTSLSLWWTDTNGSTATHSIYWNIDFDWRAA